MAADSVEITADEGSTIGVVLEVDDEIGTTLEIGLGVVEVDGIIATLEDETKVSDDSGIGVTIDDEGIIDPVSNEAVDGVTMVGVDEVGGGILSVVASELKTSVLADNSSGTTLELCCVVDEIAA